MGEFFGSVWWLLVTLGLLITLHEYGHFWVARRMGVRVLRFSIGFGTPLWRKVGRDGTEYVVAAIPLGGYVRMLDEREPDQPVDADARTAFNRQPLKARAAIVAAGPIANLAFAVLAFWAMFVVGKPDYLPNVGATTGLAAEAGIARGDRLLALDGEALPTWTQAQIALVRAALARRDVPLTIREADGDERTLVLPLSKIPEGHDERAALVAIGLSAWRPWVPAEIGRVREDSPAARAGLAAGDRIVAMGGMPVEGFEAIPPLLQELAAGGDAVAFTVARGGERIELMVQPEASAQADGSRRWLVGIEPVAQRFPPDTELRHGPLAAIPAAFAETWKMTTTTFEFLKHMVVGRASLENLSGPIGIAQTANVSATLGVAWFLSFLALMSLSIGLLNLMPVPILDGGHLLYYLIEAIKGSPVSERVLAAGQYVGLVLLAGLMGLAFYNDIARLLS